LSPLRPGTLAVFGGTFDPPHRGHLEAALAVRDRLGVERVILVPAAVPPHRPAPAAPFEARLDLVRELIRGRERLDASALERERSGPSFTLDTLNLFSRESSASPPLFVVGADAFRDIRTWSRHEELLARFPVVVHSRAGISPATAVGALPARLRTRVVEGPDVDFMPPLLLLLEADLPDISSRVLRERLRRGAPVTGMLPPPVEARIREQGLYR